MAVGKIIVHITRDGYLDPSTVLTGMEGGHGARIVAGSKTCPTPNERGDQVDYELAERPLLRLFQ